MIARAKPSLLFLGGAGDSLRGAEPPLITSIMSINTKQMIKTVIAMVWTCVYRCVFRKSRF